MPERRVTQKCHTDPLLPEAGRGPSVCRVLGSDSRGHARPLAQDSVSESRHGNPGGEHQGGTHSDPQAAGRPTHAPWWPWGGGALPAATRQANTRLGSEAQRQLPAQDEGGQEGGRHRCPGPGSALLGPLGTCCRGMYTSPPHGRRRQGAPFSAHTPRQEKPCWNLSGGTWCSTSARSVPVPSRPSVC